MDALATAAEPLTPEPDVVRLPVVEQLEEERRIKDIIYSIHATLSFLHLSNVTVELQSDTIFVISEIPGLCDSMLDMNRSLNALHAHGEIRRICDNARMDCQFIHPVHFEWMNEELAMKAAQAELTQQQPLPLPMAVPHPA